MRAFKVTKPCACGCGLPVTSYRCQNRKYVNKAHYTAHMTRPVRVCKKCGSTYKLKRRFKVGKFFKPRKSRRKE